MFDKTLCRMKALLWGKEEKKQEQAEKHSAIIIRVTVKLYFSLGSNDETKY